MALIQCNECGSMVSDKAIVCIKCGNPIDNAKRELEKQHKQKRAKLIKLISKISISIFIVVILIIGITPKGNPIVGNVKLNASYNKTESLIYKKYGGDAIKRNGEENESLILTIENYLGYDGVKGVLEYRFQEDKLLKIVILVENNDSSIPDLMLKKNLIKQLADVYGSEYDNSESYRYIWELDNTNVELSHMGEGLLIITVESEDYQDK